MADYRAVILDVDGTLIDSNDAHAHAWMAALREYGFDVPFERIRKLIGMGGDHLLPEVTGLDAESDIGSRIDQRRGAIFKTQYLPVLQPFPQVRPLMERFRAQGMKLVVASSAKEEELEPLLKIAGIDDLIEQQTSSDDAEQSKPSPDIVAAALERAAVTPEQAIMLGDTPYDVEAALKAGIAILGVRCGGWSDADLKGAAAVYADPADLLANYDQLPLGG